MKRNSKSKPAHFTKQMVDLRTLMPILTMLQARNHVASKAAKKSNSMPAANMMAGIFDNADYGTAPMSMPFQLAYDNSYTPISLNRILLSYSYMTHGVVQTAIDQPVEDAFRGGLILKSDELDEEDLADFHDYLERCHFLKHVKDVMKWAKLYGGAGLIINTDQDPTTELDLDLIDENSPIDFIAADRWELTLNYITPNIECPYNYYGQPLHSSRVIKVSGKEAPSFIRRRLQGWGMSELERMIRTLQSYTKNEDVIYELLDEAKIDVWRIDGFNQQLLNSVAQGKMTKRLNIASLLKNYHRAIVMDKEDEYEQKQIAFSGLPEILNQNRIGAAASVRMPMAKLFGLSAAGFNSGEDDIENYNALIESEVRAKVRDVLIEVLPVCFMQKFGFVPKYQLEFHPLRVLSAEQEENVKNHKFNRLSTLFGQGMVTGKEYAEALKQDNIFSMATEVSKGLKDPEPPTPAVTFTPPAGPVAEKAPEGGE